MRIPDPLRRVLVLAIALLPVSLSRAYQPGAGSQRVSVDLGGAFPNGANGFSDFAKPGPVLGAQYWYGIDDYFGVGAQADTFIFASSNHTLSSAAGGRLDAHYQTNAAAWEIMGRFALIPEAQFVPYLHSGLGLSYFHQKSDGTPLPGSSWADTNTRENRPLQDVSTFGLAFSFGAGVETELTHNLLLGLEAGWQLFGVSKNTYGTKTFDVPTIVLRLAWRFAPPPQPDFAD